MADNSSFTAPSVFDLPPSASHYTPPHSVSQKSSRRTLLSRQNGETDYENMSEMDGENRLADVPSSKPQRPISAANLQNELIHRFHQMTKQREVLDKEIADKNSLIASQEQGLVDLEDEVTKLSEAFDKLQKEKQKVDKKIVLLESGSDKALEALITERDEALQLHADSKKRSDLIQQKQSAKDDELKRVHDALETEIEERASERQKKDNYIHVLETRIKHMAAALEAVQGASPKRQSVTAQAMATPERAGSKLGMRAASRASGTQSALSHHRHGSRGSFDSNDGSVRLSRDIPRSVAAGNTLAQELELDEEDDNGDYEEYSSEALPEENIPRRPFSTQSVRDSAKAKRVLGLSSGEDDATIHLDIRPPLSDRPSEISFKTAVESVVQVSYEDASTQWEEPLVPLDVGERKLDTILEAETPRSSIYMDYPPTTPSQPPLPMVSTACQTSMSPPSPPATPLSHKDMPFSAMSKQGMVNNATQTAGGKRHSTSSSLAAQDGDSASTIIPTITIDRPNTPHSPQSVVLPPQTRSSATQTKPSATMRSTSVQTTEQSPEHRASKLPGHLLPSALEPKAPLVRPRSSGKSTITERPDSKRSSVQSTQAGGRVSTIVRTFEDAGAIVRSRRESMEAAEFSTKRSARQSRTEDSMPDFERMLIPEEAEEERGIDFYDLSDDSDDAVEPIRKTLTKVQDSWKVLPNEIGTTSTMMNTSKPRNSLMEDRLSATPVGKTRDPSITSSPRSSSRYSVDDSVLDLKTSFPIEPIRGYNRSMKDKERDIRKAALISSGVAAHQSRPRSPSAPELPSLKDTAPPFPVPDRSSSKKLPWDGADDQASPPPGPVSFYGGGMYGRKHIKRKTGRKVKSDTTSRTTGHKSRSRSVSPTPPMPFDMDWLPSATLPEELREEFRQPSPPIQRSIKPRHNHSTSQQGSISIAASLEESLASESTSVLDAMTQTMIGEYMWKYVRKRKTFGLPEANATQAELEAGKGDSGQRHQRWVWLAPYERAIMWSTKQPTSSAALMGKSGRKLVIQSVLDVRDDTPLPKGAEQYQPFGRSILVLTAERALKFTAMSRDRHYVWLTALSFLSHSSVLPTAIGGIPPMPGREAPPVPVISSGPTSTATLHRNKVHDSVRIAKNKQRPVFQAPVARVPQTYTPAEAVYDAPESDDDAAEPPLVPRFSSGAALAVQKPKRRTGLFGGSSEPPVPRRPSFPSFNTAPLPTSAPAPAAGVRNSNGHTGWMTDGTSTRRGSFISGPSSIAGRTSRSSGWRDTSTYHSESSHVASIKPAPPGYPPPPPPNFFELTGPAPPSSNGVNGVTSTMRMEAFVQGIEPFSDKEHDRQSRKKNRNKAVRDSLQVLREHSKSGGERIERRNSGSRSRQRSSDMRRTAGVRRTGSKGRTNDHRVSKPSSNAEARRRPSGELGSAFAMDDISAKARHSYSKHARDRSRDFMKTYDAFRLPSLDAGDPFSGF